MVGSEIAKTILWHTKSSVDQESKGNHDTTTDNEW